MSEKVKKDTLWCLGHGKRISFMASPDKIYPFCYPCFRTHKSRVLTSEESSLDMSLPLLYPTRCSETQPILDAKERLSIARSSSYAHYGPCWPSWSKQWRCHPQNLKMSSLYQTSELDQTRLMDLFSVTCVYASVNLCSCVLSVNIHWGSPPVLRYRRICQYREVRRQWFLSGIGIVWAEKKTLDMFFPSQYVIRNRNSLVFTNFKSIANWIWMLLYCWRNWSRETEKHFKDTKTRPKSKLH